MRRVARRNDDPEDRIQAEIVADLVIAGWRRGIDFWHTPNGRKVSKREAGKRRDAGVGSGVPDLLFSAPPPNFPGYVMAALEVKSPTGSLSKNQKLWFEEHAARPGWLLAVAGARGCKTEKDSVEACRKVLVLWGYLK